MSKFKTNLTLSNKELKGKRADAVVEDAKIGAEDEIREYSDKLRGLKRKLMDLEDFGPENNTSLRPVAKGFNGREWFKELSTTKIEIKLLEEELKIIKDTYDEYFSEEVEQV